jgi:hypothetical protein
MLGAICPLHKVAAFGAPDDRRIGIHLLCIDEEGETEPTALPTEVLKGFRRSPAALGRLVLNLIAAKKASLKNELGEVSGDAQEACDDILNIILSEMFNLIDEKFRRSRIEELYGTASGLGIVSPSQWPNPPPQRVDESDTAVLSDKESKEAESISTSSSSDTDSEEEKEPPL